MRKVKELGLKIKLDTNGSRPGMLASYMTENLLDYVAMDVKAPLEKYHLLGFSDSGMIEDSINLIKISGIAHEFRTTCPKIFLQPEDFPKMAELVGKTSKWYLQTFNPRKTLDPAYNNVASYSREELEVIIKNLGIGNAEAR